MHTIKTTERTLLLLNEKTVYSSWQRSAFEGKNGISKARVHYAGKQEFYCLSDALTGA